MWWHWVVPYVHCCSEKISYTMSLASWPSGASLQVIQHRRNNKQQLSLIQKMSKATVLIALIGTEHKEMPWEKACRARSVQILLSQDHRLVLRSCAASTSRVHAPYVALLLLVTFQTAWVPVLKQSEPAIGKSRWALGLWQPAEMLPNLRSQGEDDSCKWDRVEVEPPISSKEGSEMQVDMCMWCALVSWWTQSKEDEPYASARVTQSNCSGLFWTNRLSHALLCSGTVIELNTQPGSYGCRTHLMPEARLHVTVEQWYRQKRCRTETHRIFEYSSQV